MVQVENLWGDEFSVNVDYSKMKQIIGKIKSPKEIQGIPVEKVISDKNILFKDKLDVIKENVYKILGRYVDDTICIYDKLEFHEYITNCIKNGVISIDTETIGTRTDIKKSGTDPFTCKICGLCIYTPGQKNAYIPINHVDYNTDERLNNQLTEKDIKEELERIINSETFTILQNGKFDHLVLHFTCNIDIPIYWDTMICAQVLNENEPAGLKWQYSNKVDKDQEKYDLDKLFDLNAMEKYPPELFALYAATDPYITYRLYEYQKAEIEKPGNEKLYTLFKDIEMPVVMVTTAMEKRGVAVDKEFAKRLSVKFHKRLDDLNLVIEKEMEKYKDIIKEWRNTPEANHTEISNGREQKSLSQKLSDPVELTSATQLGILLYDILRVLKVGKDGKKSTDETALKSIEDKLPLAKLILQMRELEKYLGTYIDVLPTYCSPRDDRVHAHFNQMGREDRNVVTGRMSSSEPSLQVIPARGEIVSVRCMFVPTTEYPEIEKSENFYIVPIENEVLLENGSYQWSSYLKPGDKLETGEEVKEIAIKDREVYIYTL